MAAGIASPRLYTIGHGAVDLERFVQDLQQAGIERLLDVRRFPGSRRHPQFGRDVLERALPEAGIAYRHVEAMGGRRRPRPDSPNVALRNEGFRGYADWMEGPEFRAAFAEAMAEAARAPVAICCAETTWWTCHRRLIADAATLLASLDVRHLVSGKLAEHRPTPGVRVAGPGLLRYDAGV